MIGRLLRNSCELNLTEGNTVRNIWALAFPIMLGNILQTAFNVVDMIWVGRLGSGAIASVAMSGGVLLVIITLVIGVSAATHSLVARFTGAGDRHAAENVAMQSLIVGTVLSVVLAAVGLIFAYPILEILGARGQVLHMGTDYLKIILMGGVAMVYLFLVCAIFRARGDAVTPMLIMVGATMLNVILDPLMIFGIGFHPMGVKGAALATVISRGLAAFLGLYILFRGSSRLAARQARLRLSLTRLRLDLKTINSIVKLGIPNSIQMGLRSIAGLVLMAIVARYGTYALAAYGIGLRIFSVVLMPGFALATTAATLVGQNVGAKKILRANICARQAAGFNSLLMGVVGVVFFTFSARLISVFNANPDVVKLGAQYLKITSLGYIFVAQGLVLGRSLVGAGDSFSPMLISVFTLLGIQLPLAIILPNYLEIGIKGVWWAILISSVLQGIMTHLWFNLGLRRHC